MKMILYSNMDSKKYDISNMVYNIQLSTELNIASKLTFSYVKQGYQAPNGSLVIFSYEDQVIFKGYIFNSTNNTENISVICYDQLKYFQNKDTILLNNQTATNILELIINKNHLVKGEIENTGVILNQQIFQNKSFLDIMNACLEETLTASKKKFILRDENGKICLRNIESLKQDVIIGTKNLASKYTYEKNIENNTFNQIKLVKKNKDTLEQFIVKDSSNINKWGLLQYYEEVNENTDNSLIKKKAEDLLSLYNKEERRLMIDDCMLNPLCIAGNIVRIYLENLGIDQYCIIKSSSLNFKDKRMNMEVML